MKIYRVIDFLKFSEKLQITSTRAMIHCNGRKKLGKGYLREMGSRIACYRTAIAALEKQEPKTPERRGSEVSGEYFLCPECKKVVGPKVNYCRQCGQKLKW
jgi:hypothetical protein